ncbi:hypothetical protein ACLB2K_021774 [Fragaria x ananassa]
MDIREAISSQTNVALELTKHLFLTEFKGKNMVFSPLSLHFALSLIASGTKGPCLEQFLSFLKSRSTHHLNSLAHDIVTFVLANASPDENDIIRGPGPRLSFANGVWVDKSLPFKPDFKHLVDIAYMAALEEVDFKFNPKQPCSSFKASGKMLIPKFKISSGFEASKVLAGLGMVLPFVYDVKGGNVTEMVESPAGEDPYVKAIFHKSCIEIDEDGTEASAVTVSVVW